MTFEGSVQADNLPPNPQSFNTDKQTQDKLKAQLGTLQLPKSIALLFDVHTLKLDNSPSQDTLDQKIADLNNAAKMLNNLSIAAPGIEGFGELISSLDLHSRAALIQIFADGDFDDLEIELTSNGFPANKLALQIFGERFNTELVFDEQEQDLKRTEKNSDKACMENLARLYDAVSSNADNSKIFVLLQEAGSGDPKSFEELRTYLLTNPKELQKLISLTREIDIEEGTRHYELLHSTLIAVDPEFLEILEILDELAAASSGEGKLMHFPSAYTLANSGAKPELNGHLFLSANHHGDTISIDVSKQPPVRTLTLESSNYPLETDNFVGVLHQPEAEFLEQRKSLSTQIATTSLLQTDQIQDHVSDLVAHGYNFSYIKHQLESSYNIDIGFINNLNALSSPSQLENAQKEYEAQLKNLEASYLFAMEEAMEQYRQDRFEQDEKTREVLQFISNIGFDVLPKEFSDQLISEVQAGMIITLQLNLNPAHMDLKHGRFGESDTEQGTSKWKEYLIRFYNLMVTGNTELPLSVEAHLATGGKQEDKITMNHHLLENGIKTEVGGFDIEQARANLRAQPENIS